jgi:hypothetical protein
MYTSDAGHEPLDTLSAARRTFVARDREGNVVDLTAIEPANDI